MAPDATTENALSHIEAMIADAPRHVRERLSGVRAYLERDRPDAEGHATAARHEDELLEQVEVRAHMLQGSRRDMTMSIRFPFDIRDWFDGRSHFDFEGEEAGRSNNDRMLSFYRRQETEKKRLYDLMHSCIAPLVCDCLGRLLARDVRKNDDCVLYGIRDAAWRAGDRSGPRPHPEGEPFEVVVDGMRHRCPSLVRTFANRPHDIGQESGEPGPMPSVQR